MKVEFTEVVSEPRKAGDNTVRNQEMWVFNGGKYPVLSVFTLWGNDEPFLPGVYEVDIDRCLVVGSFSRLELRIRRDAISPLKASVRNAG